VIQLTILITDQKTLSTRFFRDPLSGIVESRSCAMMSAGILKEGAHHHVSGAETEPSGQGRKHRHSFLAGIEVAVARWIDRQ
jgi:hypothetical protein